MWKPLLHEVAAGTQRAGLDRLDYFVHARAHHFAFQLGRMGGIDRAKREVILGPVTDETGTELVPARRLAYDTLIIAVGSVANDFGVPGVQEHCKSKPNASSGGYWALSCADMRHRKRRRRTSSALPSLALARPAPSWQQNYARLLDGSPATESAP